MYEYRARPVRAVDGDTIEVVADLGFGLALGTPSLPLTLRLIGIDTPELRSKDRKERAAAKRAHHFTGQWLLDSAELNGVEWPVRITTERDDAFGRWLATVTNGRSNLAVDLLDAGLGTIWERG